MDRSASARSPPTSPDWRPHPAGLPTVAGFAAAQAGTIRQTLTTLGAIADLTLVDDGAALRIAGGTAVPVALADRRSGGERPRRRRSVSGTKRAAPMPVIPDAIWVSYGDLAREYQTGIQAATRRTPAIRIEQRDLAIASDARAAKTMAETALRRAIAARSTARIDVPWRYADVRPGDLVRSRPATPSRGGSRTAQSPALIIELAISSGLAGTPGSAVAADAGRVYLAPDATTRRDDPPSARFARAAGRIAHRTPAADRRRRRQRGVAPGRHV